MMKINGLQKFFSAVFLCDIRYSAARAGSPFPRAGAAPRGRTGKGSAAGVPEVKSSGRTVGESGVTQDLAGAILRMV